MITFLTITYNQDRFIIEHLESIKYQIKNFGKDQDYSYILSDDCSTDSTVSLAKRWIELNDDLFKEVKILTSEKNLGVVQNYLKASEYINTKSFKILAGDDLYYLNNISEVIENYDVVFTPTITFDKNGIKDCVSVNTLLAFKELKKIKKLMKLDNCFNAPGSFVTDEIIKDSGLRKFISNFKWIEDAPQWYYLLNYKKDIRIKIKNRPYILYRLSEGISMGEANGKYNEFIIEKSSMIKKLDFNLTKYPKYINPYRYYAKFVSLKVKYFDEFTKKDIIEANKVMKNELMRAPNYLDEIRKKALEFYKDIGEEKVYVQVPNIRD